MHRVYEWVKFIVQQKVNVFIKGAFSGGFVSAIFLFGSNLSSHGAFVVAFLIKTFAVIVTGLLSGFATVLGNDIYQWAKAKFIKKKATKIKRKKVA